jgi:hypothetical protein
VRIGKEPIVNKEVENINQSTSPKDSSNISISTSPLREIDNKRDLLYPREIIPINTLMRLIHHLLPKVAIILSIYLFLL